MLFDLRSRGRRRTVQVVYIGLAILIGAGLVLFGVGTGSGGGGLFGGLTSSGSSHSGDSALNAQTKSALAQTRKTPKSAAAWSSLVEARFSAASANVNSSNTAYTSTGQRQLTLLAQAYQHYTSLTSSPSVGTATIAGEAYSALGQYANASGAYQAVIAAAPDNLTAIGCVAYNSYAAGNTRVAQLAQAKYLTKVPKAQRKLAASQLESAKTDKSVVLQYCSALGSS